MFVTRYNPISQTRDFQRGFNLLNSMLDSIEEQKHSLVTDDFTPNVNTREGEFAYHIEVDLPGIDKEDVNIEIEDSKLIISGERKTEEEIKEEDYYKIESSFGSFSRSFSIPEEVDVENIHASSKDGVLEVVLPKLENAKIDKVTKIQIK
ncbi:MAG: Hsp20/alpha crystallin family protein [Sulfurimonas sp.]|nr:Hsp20/alpha crystallin family protein [Sulfurimonas sp.]